MWMAPGITCPAEPIQDSGVRSEWLGPHADFLETVVERSKGKLPLFCPASSVPN